MAPVKPEILNQKNIKHAFPFLKKGSGVQSRKVNNIPVNVRDCSKRKANFSPKKDDRTKKPLVDKTNEKSSSEKFTNRTLGNVNMKPSAVMKRDMENIMPASMKLRPRGKNTINSQPKLQQREPKFPQPRKKLPQPYIASSEPPQEKNCKGTVTVSSSSNPGSAPAYVPDGKLAAELQGGRPSLDSTKSDDNLLYVTALEECFSATTLSETSTIKSDSVGKSSDKKPDATLISVPPNEELSHAKPADSHLPPGVHDYDGETWDDPYQASCYAMDIFGYLKSREGLFVVDRDYMTRQKGINIWMRATLVDWMVEVQETFELNHETLYLAVKVVDLFLTRSKSVISKERLQLLGAAAVFIACKYDERHIPTVEDFKLISDEAFTKSELLSMEGIILKTLDFNLGAPLSYRFLRRYARCCKASMQVLTLARYILESSLMDYSLIHHSDSKLAAAALLLALKMLKIGSWTPTLAYYSGYSINEIKSVTYELNAMLHKPRHDSLQSIKTKYSHRIFLEVALVPHLNDQELDL